MLAMTVGTALAASPASAATGMLTGHAGLVGGGWPWPPTGTQGWVPGGPINLVGRTFSQTNGQAESTNWSGYAGTTGTYTSVSATWTQPKGTCTRGDQYAAFWVGLDGYSSSTVEQTGSEVDCVGRTAEYYAWYEAYPAASKDYSNTVKAGDVFNSTVTYTGNNQFSLFIQDVTESWSHTTTVTVSGAKRTSAEVIAEAPCCTFLGGILPLTNFGTMNFTNSKANGADLGAAGGLTEITMVDQRGRDKDTVSALTPSGATGQNFSCTWKASS
ncbi:MAG: G1 family glutamic endopeptidase [Streptosporangiaceae bacterium]